ncbi:MAG: type II toxin-antitoxin system RelB/DinJ family antitoxin [Lachnospiraceae bacterium]|jgi:addiction module RelB/DinJ family antitoxin|nr:type II toxin-antitoxin system RelB/DinJ family antitoxin [Lachnospiraceae bacterium]
MIMPKTSSIYTRVEPEIKEQAERILTQLGIPVANAINLFLHQVVLRKGIPFEVSLPPDMPLDYARLSKEQVNIELEKGMDDVVAGRVTSAKQVREEMEQLRKH